MIALLTLLGILAAILVPAMLVDVFNTSKFSHYTVLQHDFDLYGVAEVYSRRGKLLKPEQITRTSYLGQGMTSKSKSEFCFRTVQEALNKIEELKKEDKAEEYRKQNFPREVKGF